jgi:hypothetical protein
MIMSFTDGFVNYCTVHIKYLLILYITQMLKRSSINVDMHLCIPCNVLFHIQVLV